MTGILKQRDIVDRKTLMAALEATQSAPTVVDRGQVLVLFKQALAAGSDEVRS